ncbi:MAG: hypothetical protein V1874_00165 [Spirochaetota bacterium]
MNLIFRFILFPLLFFVLINSLYAETSITVTLSTAVEAVLDSDDFNTAEMARQIQDTSDLNGPFVANAFALANVLGYPIGKSYLGSFPHFEIGLAAGSGCTNMKYFDENDPAHDNDTLPMFAPNAVLHFGIGIGGGVDILGKMFYVSKSVVNKYKSDIDYETDVATLKDYKIYSVGGKIRYNFIPRKKFLPFYLAFGGLTFSLGGNFMYGDISFTGDYQYDFENITVSGLPSGVPMHFDGAFDANIHWAIFTIDAQAVAYFDIFYLFSLYSGFGVAGNIGSFKVKFKGEGDFTTDTTYPPVLTTTDMGTLTFLSENKYRPSPVIPLYILGLEINILVLKLNAETMVNLLNRSDVNVQFGTRLQF